MADVIVGYDGSETANAALDIAAEIARASGDRLVLAFGFSDPALGGESADMRAALEEMGETRVAAGAERARAAGVEVDTVVAQEPPADLLGDLAGKRSARMIVVGSRGEGPVRGLLLGSTPYRLLHTATVPVLVVPVSQ